MGAVEVLEIENTECKVYKFPNSKEIKYTKNGEIKKTPNNTKENRDNTCPIKKEDIRKITEYLKLKIANSTNYRNEMAAKRNFTLFVVGINIALRVSDLIALKWSDVYNNDWTFRDGKVIKPKKTANSNKHVILKFNSDFKSAIEFYRKDIIVTNDIDINSYIFKGNTEDHISDATVEHFLKQVSKDLDIKYNINTHSLRKTFCRLRYDDAEDKTDVLVKLMCLLGHSSTRVTKRYIGIEEKEIEDLFNAVSIGFE